MIDYLAARFHFTWEWLTRIFVCILSSIILWILFVPPGIQIWICQGDRELAWTNQRKHSRSIQLPLGWCVYFNTFCLMFSIKSAIQLWNKVVDVLVAQISPLSGRHKVIDLSSGFNYDTFALLIPVSNNMSSNTQAIIQPFQWPVSNNVYVIIIIRVGCLYFNKKCQLLT